MYVHLDIPAVFTHAEMMRRVGVLEPYNAIQERVMKADELHFPKPYKPQSLHSRCYTFTCHTDTSINLPTETLFLC